MHPGPRTLLRTAPWTRAPGLGLREPAVALVVVGVAFVIGVVAAAGPLFNASTGSAAFALEMSQQCTSDLGPVATGSGPLDHVAHTNASLAALAARNLEAAGAPPEALDPPVVTMDSYVAVGRGARVDSVAQLATRQGALAHIDPVARTSGPGVWIPNDLAASLHLRPGGHLSMAALKEDGTAAATRTMVRVSGIYRSLVGTVLPPFWCSLKGIMGTVDENAPPPPVILTTSGRFTGLLEQMRQPTVAFYRWERSASGDVSLQQANATTPAVTAFQHEVGSRLTHRGVPERRLPDGFRIADAMPLQYGFLVAHAQAVQQAVSQGITPEIAAGLLVGLLLLGSASVFWTYRRRTEVQLLQSRGVAPVALGIKAGLEAMPLMVVGALLGWAGGLALLMLVGPSSAFGTHAVAESALFALVAELLALVLLAAMSALLTSGARRRPGSALSALAKVPFELLGIGVAIWLWQSLQNVSLEAGGTSAPALQSGFLLMPLLLLLSVSVLFARLASIGLRRVRRLPLRHAGRLPGWMAMRRLAAAPSLGMLMVGSVALAVGAFTYAGAVARSQEYTLTAKAQTMVGSNSSVTVPALVHLPPSLESNSTEVLTETGGTVGSAPVIVLGVNPSTFAQGAFWDSSYSGQSLGQLMDALAATPTSHQGIPVIAGGPGGVSFKPGLLLPYSTPVVPRRVHVVGTASTFPGQNGTDPILIMSRASLARLDPAAYDQIWTKAPADEATAALRRAGIDFSAVQSSSTELGQIAFAPLHWTFEALQGLGVLVGILAFAGLFLFLTARSRARALSYALGLKMGVTRRTHLQSLGIEIGLLFGAALAIGMGTAWVATLLVTAVLNPYPDVPPGSLTVVPWLNIVITLLVAGVVWASSALWAQHVTERRSVAGVFRYDID